MKVNLEELCSVIAAILAHPAHQHRLVLASLDPLALCAYIVDRAGSVRELNGCANSSNGQFDALARDPGFRAALRAATRSPARASLLPMRGDSGAFQVAIAPLDCGAALVVVGASRSESGDALQAVRRHYGLTDTEARVMCALSAGRKVGEIAHEHGVQACTVRAQVRSLFEKTGVNRQSDLIRLALTGDMAMSRSVHKQCSGQHVRKSDDAQPAARWQRSF